MARYSILDSIVVIDERRVNRANVLSLSLYLLTQSSDISSLDRHMVADEREGFSTDAV